ncbi:ATPase [Paenibacillus sp. J31TS4]|uniref:AAA family ATPase n=1 Tax=Paenibacillus sp. J31TS4 TaxID=2807195 RepID=UPI001B282F87|nr:AAA family ATPase [Paenibacillus sp. J31TS4]GIP39642.1 ATPase [Paenibacillus sp. J31TS4]
MIESQQQLAEWRETIAGIREQIGEVIVGQQEVVEQLLWCLLAGGHALVEGIPGLGKTMLVKTVADTVDLSFSRIQFTPDLMPADITGTNIISFGAQGEAAYRFERGPLFGNLVLADEINRATPKTQSALLEAMQERTVTVGPVTHKLPEPFFVLATQNPLEQEGTYALPEAQLDRFLLKIHVTYPTRDELKAIVMRTTGGEERRASRVTGGETIAAIQRGARDILLAEDVLEEAVRLVMMTHPGEPDAPEEVKRYVRFGSGPRGLQAVVSVAKVRALMAGRLHVSRGDLRQAALPALRHRIFLSYEGQASGMTADAVLHSVLARWEAAP